MIDIRYLNKINSPKDLKDIANSELKILCKEIREEIISTISKTGGHIASSLGVVELTVALHKVFNCPQDKIIWDVGHQSYAHKILTGRRDRFKTIRQYKGLSGFPKQTESEYDAFIGGHSSTSISAAYGICKAGKLLNQRRHVIAIIGDGSLTGGLAYEGLNNAGKDCNESLIVILNDNKMSISHNVGAIATYLSKIRNNPSYFKFKDQIKKGISKLPMVAEKIRYAVEKSKGMIKDTIYNSNVFESLGFDYLGPVDGHNIKNLIDILTRAKQLNKPVLVHINTIKGKGYRIAEKNPSVYHGISQNNLSSTNKQENTDFSYVFGDELTKLASEDKKIVAITAAMTTGTGLCNFSKKFPNQFFDVGIAEQHAVTFASGLASIGCIPVFAVYSSFLQRSFDQIIHDASIESQHIILAVDRAGIVGEDGETHQGIFDVSFLSLIPKITIFSPSNYEELRKYLKTAIYEYSGVVAVRYPRGKEQYIKQKYRVNSGRDFNIWHENRNINLVITYGRFFSIVCDMKDYMEQDGEKISIMKLDKIWPINEEAILLATQFKNILFVEESIKSGGVAEHFGIKLMEKNFKGSYKIKAIDNQFVSQGTFENLIDELGFSAKSLAFSLIKGQLIKKSIN